MEESSMPAVVCVACGERLFYCKAVGRDFAGDKIHAEDFVPVDDSIPAPRMGAPMVCPKCDKSYVASALKEGGGAVLKLEDGSWWPHPPLGKI